MLLSDGALCVTFVNTGSGKRSALASYDDLLAWGVGRPRKFCGTRCRNRSSTRRYYQKELKPRRRRRQQERRREQAARRAETVTAQQRSTDEDG